MGKILRITFILLIIMLSFYSLSFADQLAKGISPTNSSNELIYAKWTLRILDQKGEAFFSSSEKAGSESNLDGASPSKPLSNRESPLNSETTITMQTPTKTEIQRKDLPYLESGLLARGKYSVHFGKIHLTKNNLDPSLDFISSLSAARYEENPLSWTLEKYRENDILKSLAILLELKLNF